MGPPRNIPGDFARITGRVSEGEPKAIPYSKENAERAPGHEGGQEKRNISHATCTPSLEKAERAKIQKIPFFPRGSLQCASVCFSIVQGCLPSYPGVRAGQCGCAHASSAHRGKKESRKDSASVCRALFGSVPFLSMGLAVLFPTGLQCSISFCCPLARRIPC